LSEDNAHYLANVLRVSKGQEVETFDGEGGTDRWEVSEATSREIRLTHAGRDQVSRKSPMQLILGLNPLKGGNEETAIRMAAAMEVQEIVPVFFKRSDVPIDFVKLERRLDRWKRFCIAEVILAGGSYLPAISRPTTLASFLDGTFEGVLFDEEADSSGESPAFALGGTVLALIGPEGGLERKEVELARESGIKIASLGAWTLRAELAGALAPYWVYSRVK
jgi:16S rRNA (uracil1498-N3)-methyltransferase